MTLDAIGMYNFLLSTANIISKTKYARFFALKGGLVLMSKMFEFSRMDLFRKTSDIDIHCSSKDIWVSFCNECEFILNSSDYAKTNRLTYRLVNIRSKSKGLDTSDSLSFEVSTMSGDIIKFKIDMNIKSDSIVEISFDNILQLNTYSEYTMMSDKIVTVSSQKIYRRIKDLYDICVLASLYRFELGKLTRVLKTKHSIELRNLTNMLKAENMSDIYHAYNSFKGIINKPDITVIMDIAQKFLCPFYNYIETGLIWDNRSCLWKRYSQLH